MSTRYLENFTQGNIAFNLETSKHQGTTNRNLLRLKDPWGGRPQKLSVVFHPLLDPGIWKSCAIRSMLHMGISRPWLVDSKTQILRRFQWGFVTCRFTEFWRSYQIQDGLDQSCRSFKWWLDKWKFLSIVVSFLISTDLAMDKSFSERSVNITLPKTNIAPKTMVSNRNFLFQWVIFRCHVSFREGRTKHAPLRKLPCPDSTVWWVKLLTLGCCYARNSHATLLPHQKKMSKKASKSFTKPLESGWFAFKVCCRDRIFDANLASVDPLCTHTPPSAL